MGNEASKTREFLGLGLTKFLTGQGIDIGCGKDPVSSSARRFDRKDGDANNVSAFVNEQFDYLFSAHCLEHMSDPKKALFDWYNLVKPGGHLVVIVPDEDLYEQGAYPSYFNADHKWTFTLQKDSSWSPKSINVKELAESLGGDVILVERHDHNYDHTIARKGISKWSKILYRSFRRWNRRLGFLGIEKWLSRFYFKLGAVIDQTDMREPRLAQIMFVVQRNYAR